MSTVTATVPTYGIDNGIRHLLTPQNLVELGLDWPTLQAFLATPGLQINGQSPDGISINESIFGNYSGPSAAALGWMAYMNVGEPLIEERANITQPPADVLSTRVYVNQSGSPTSFNDEIDFTVSNTFNWSLKGTAQLTFGGSASAAMAVELQQRLESSLARTTANTHIQHNHAHDVGTEDRHETETVTTNTTTETGTGSATGTGEVDAELLLGITGAVSGSLMTSWVSNSAISGDIAAASRVETMVTQRRQIRQYIYQLPIDVAGYVALHYPLPVPVGDSPPQAPSTAKVNVIARNISSLSNLLPAGQSYRSTGMAETVSALAVEHTVFASEPISAANSALSIDRPHFL
ncbi:hypothetical protein [Chromobacterium violaceum]|uniref:hypothetical protein n=1 Tax=Chromobacterium violaceum TaxID=536 RepID=UPI001CE1020C|nr:hypothetical protein [Chromobacterium violaceum]